MPKYNITYNGRVMRYKSTYPVEGSNSDAKDTPVAAPQPQMQPRCVLLACSPARPGLSSSQGQVDVPAPTTTTTATLLLRSAIQRSSNTTYNKV